MEGSIAIKGPNTEKDSTAAIGRAPVILSALDRMLISIMAIVGPAKVIATRPKSSLSALSRSFFRLDTPATGATTVPFILALAAGVSSLKKDREGADKERFGLVAITFAGPTIAIMLMSILSKADRITSNIPIAAVESSSVISPFIAVMPSITRVTLIAIRPILVVFLVFQVVAFKLPKASVKNILSGMLLTFIGLVMFLLGANAGFMEVGNAVGYNIALLDNKGLLILIGFIIGVVTVLAEPAAYVLVDEVEQVTNGNLKRSVVLFTLSLGVGAAVSLSMVRILIPQVQLWHYLLPGYIISLAMTYFVPELFSGIAFDSGAVVSGPMTATFILAFAHGVADAVEHASLLVDGFGIVAMVAMTPIIALQILGFIYNRKPNVEEPITEQELSTEQEPISITLRLTYKRLTSTHEVDTQQTQFFTNGVCKCDNESINAMRSILGKQHWFSHMACYREDK